MPPSEARGWKRLWRRSRFTVLLAALAVNILTAPIVATIQTERRQNLGEVIVLLSFALMLLITVLAVQPRHRLLWIVTGFAAVTLVVSWVGLVSGHHSARLAKAVLSAGFTGMVAILTLRHVFVQRIITYDVLAASLCAYLLLGVAWSSAYGAIDILVPGSFHVIDDGFGAFHEKGVGAATRRLYFSFVTILTLGYGDVVPVGSIARLSAVMETFCGQVLMVVLVARLVGVLVSQEMVASNAANKVEKHGEDELP